MAITRRRWMLGATAGAAGCGRRRRGADPNSITVLYIDDETVLGPDQWDPAQFLMFLPLAVYNGRGEWEGRLAERWEHSADYRTWRIRLREGIRWHDGVPFTAHDVKFTIDLLSHPDALWWPSGSVDVCVTDELNYTITCRGNGRKATIWDDWTVYYPRHILSHLNPKGFSTWDFWRQPVGNGPYRYVRHVPKTMLQLEANPDFYRGAPRIPNVVLKFGEPFRGGAITELLSSAVDAATYISRADVLKLSTDSRFRVHNQVRHSTLALLNWNHHSPLFRDAVARKALTLAIDRREFMRVLDLPEETPVVDAPVSRGQIQRREFAVPIPYDPRLANQLLDQAGWYRRNRQGIRVRDGKAFEFTASTGISTLGGGGAGAVYVAAQLQRIGVRMNVKILEPGVLNQRVSRGEEEALLWGIGGTATDWTGDDCPLQYLFDWGYRSPQFLSLVDRFKTVREPDEEDRLYGELTLLFQQDVPATFLHPDVLTTVARRRIRGLERCPYRGDATWCMDQLWLEEQS